MRNQRDRNCVKRRKTFDFNRVVFINDDVLQQKAEYLFGKRRNLTCKNIKDTSIHILHTSTTSRMGALCDDSILKRLQSCSLLLTLIPVDIFSHIVTFLPTSSRMSLLQTCVKAKRILTAPHMLRSLDLIGEPLSGKGSFILDSDTKERAMTRITPLVQAGNLNAIHM